MTAHSASPAPTLQTSVAYPDSDDDEEAARETQDFLAGLMQESYADEHDGYLSPNDGPVRAFANMLSSNDIYLDLVN